MSRQGWKVETHVEPASSGMFQRCKHASDGRMAKRCTIGGCRDRLLNGDTLRKAVSPPFGLRMCRRHKSSCGATIDDLALHTLLYRFNVGRHNNNNDNNMCYFSREHIALSYKKWCEHRIMKNQQIKSTAHN